MIDAHDIVAGAAITMQRQAGELLEARVRLIRAESLLRQSQTYIGFSIERWKAAGAGTEPAASLTKDIDKFLEEARS